MSLPPSQGLGKIYQDSSARGCGCPQIPGGPGQCHQTLDLPVLPLQERDEAPELCWLPDPANDMLISTWDALLWAQALQMLSGLLSLQTTAGPPYCPQAA